MSFCVLYWVVEVLYIYIYIYLRCKSEKKRCTYYSQAIFASIKMKILHIDAFLHSFLNCLLKSWHSLFEVMFEEETLEIVFVLKVFEMAKKYIYIHTHTHSHRMLWWVLWACNLCIEFRRAFQRKNVSTKSWRWSRIFPDKLLDLILLGEKSLCEFFFSLLMPWKAFLKFMSLPKYILKIKIKSYVFLNNFLKI